ncbi:IS30 family transposase [Clostridium sp. AN503]|uniref:IS30 family transposase n=1 Tax=Clostridium sp. AN503 TaxID=3160598 RepID=UPI00345AA4A4
MGKRKDLTERERYNIELLLKEKKSISQIAKILNRHYQTIYREVKRGTVELLGPELKLYKCYCADRGQMIADENKREKGRELKVANDLEFIRFIEHMILEKHYSPSAALAYIRNNGLNFKTSVCYTTLYSYIEKGLLLNVTNKDLPVKSKRKKKNMHRIQKINTKNLKGRSVEKRDENILDRADIGHWEMDTVVGKQGGTKDCLLVLTERKTRYEYIIKIPDKTQVSVVKALDDLEHIYGYDSFRDCFKTITMDNGVEFLDMIGIERSCLEKGKQRTEVYYCHPYCSFERGSNENQNKFVRRWIPKGEDISQFDNDYIQRMQEWINDYPRKLFDWKSAREMLFMETA